MSGFQIWIPKEHLEYYHQCYTKSGLDDILKMGQRIENILLSDDQEDAVKEERIIHPQGENTSHSTTEGNAVYGSASMDEDENDIDGSIMDRADVLFKYILRSFRKHYCKSF